MAPNGASVPTAAAPLASPSRVPIEPTARGSRRRSRASRSSPRRLPPAQPPGMCLDQGDDDDEGGARLAECGFTAPIRARGEEAKALTPEAGFKARRWVVERTPSGMKRVRRVLIRWDKHVGNNRAVLHLACVSMTYRQA